MSGKTPADVARLATRLLLVSDEGNSRMSVVFGSSDGRSYRISVAPRSEGSRPWAVIFLVNEAGQADEVVEDRFEGMPLVVPTVHLNGTSYDGLMEPLCKAAVDLRRARESLQDAAPHGRDYYVQGDDAFAAAMKQHVSRLARLETVYAELLSLTEGIGSQSPRKAT